MYIAVAQLLIAKEVPGFYAAPVDAIAAQIRSLLSNRYRCNGGIAEKKWWKNNVTETWEQHITAVGVNGQWAGFADVVTLAAILRRSFGVVDPAYGRRLFGRPPLLGDLLWQHSRYESFFETGPTSAGQALVLPNSTFVYSRDPSFYCRSPVGVRCGVRSPGCLLKDINAWQVGKICRCIVNSTAPVTVLFQRVPTILVQRRPRDTCSSRYMFDCPGLHA